MSHLLRRSFLTVNLVAFSSFAQPVMADRVLDDLMLDFEYLMGSDLEIPQVPPLLPLPTPVLIPFPVFDPTYRWPEPGDYTVPFFSDPQVPESIRDLLP